MTGDLISCEGRSCCHLLLCLVLGKDDCQCMIIGQLDLVLLLVLALELLKVIERCYRQGEVPKHAFFILHLISFYNEKSHLRNTGDGLLVRRARRVLLPMVRVNRHYPLTNFQRPRRK